MKNKQCPFCSCQDLTYECKYPDFENKIVDIYSCNNCFCFVPDYDDVLSSTVEKQTKFHENLWSADSIESWLEAKMGMVTMLTKQQSVIGMPGLNNIICDIGAGRGNLTAALLELGYHTYACEPSHDLYKKAQCVYDICSDKFYNESAVAFIDRLSDNDVSPNTFYFWHVLEHMIGSAVLLRNIVNLFSGKELNLMIQMPLLKSEYVYPEHYFLATPDWFKYVSSLLGLNIVHFNQSTDSFFATAFLSNNKSLSVVDFKAPFKSLSQFEKQNCFMAARLYSNI